MKLIHIHVTKSVQATNLHSADIKIPGVYAVEVNDEITEGVAAWTAFEAFQENTPVERFDDFSYNFFDLETRQFLRQFNPVKVEGVHCIFRGRIAD